MLPGLVWTESPCPHGVYGLKHESFLELVLCRNSESGAIENEGSWRRVADRRMVWAGVSGRRHLQCDLHEEEERGRPAK